MNQAELLALAENHGARIHVDGPYVDVSLENGAITFDHASELTAFAAALAAQPSPAAEGRKPLTDAQIDRIVAALDPDDGACEEISAFLESLKSSAIAAPAPAATKGE